MFTKQYTPINLAEVYDLLVCKLKLIIPSITVVEFPERININNRIYNPPEMAFDFVRDPNLIIAEVVDKIIIDFSACLLYLRACGNVYLTLRPLQEKLFEIDNTILMQFIFSAIVVKPTACSIPNEDFNIHWYDENKNSLCMGKPSNNVVPLRRK